LSWKGERYKHGLCAKGIKTSYKGKLNPKYNREFIVWARGGDFEKVFPSYFEALNYVHIKITEGGWPDYLITEQISDAQTNKFVREKKLANIKSGKIIVEG
jgi:hypothetical protein